MKLFRCLLLALVACILATPVMASTIAFSLTNQPGAHPIRHMNSAIYISGSAQPREYFDLDTTYHAGDVLTVTGNVENWAGVLPTLFISADSGDLATSDVTATGPFSVTITLTADATRVYMQAMTYTTGTVDNVVVIVN